MCISIDPSKYDCWKVLSETVSSHISAIRTQIATWRTLTLRYPRFDLQRGRVKSMKWHFSGWEACIRSSLCCFKTISLFLSLLLLYRVTGIHSSPSHVLIPSCEFHFLRSIAVHVRLTFCSTLLLGLLLVSLAGLPGRARPIHFHLFLL